MATNVWDADIAVDAALAARVIGAQFPQLRPVTVAAFGSGWDNVAFLANGEYVFRFPRRRVAVALLETESRCLPAITPYLPLAVPNPAFVGEPDDLFPFLFAGYPLLPGTTACRVAWTDGERAACAKPLARFLRTLHALPVSDDARAAPPDTLNRANIAGRVGVLRERLAKIAAIAPQIDADNLLSRVDALAQTTPYAGPPRLVHGDLYARHLLVNERRQPCGVIDWGDLHRGDPALDLSIAFSFLPPDARPTFRAAYGGIDEATWDRARFRAIHYGAILTLYGADTGDKEIEAAGRYALAFNGD